nr:HIT family protein [Candidatus Levybacteria bacterium]
MNSCAFCSDEIYKRVIEEGEHAIVFLSNPRLAFGHILIVPKRHTQKLTDLTKDETKEIMNFLTKYQERVIKKISKGTIIVTNYKPYKPDSKTRVNHFHFHILPINQGDEYETEVESKKSTLYKDLSEEENVKVTKLLK